MLRGNPARHDLETIERSRELSAVCAAPAADEIGDIELEQHRDGAEPYEHVVAHVEASFLAEGREDRSELDGTTGATADVLGEVKRERRFAEIAWTAGHALERNSGFSACQSPRCHLAGNVA